LTEIEVNLALGCWREGWSANRSSFGVEIEPTFAASAAFGVDNLRLVCRALAHATALNSGERRLVNQTGIAPAGWPAGSAAWLSTGCVRWLSEAKEVDQTGASWNHVIEWIRQLDCLRQVSW